MFRGILSAIIACGVLAIAAPKPQLFRRPLVFEPNRGQAPAPVKWLARGPGYQLFITSEGVTMTMQESSAEPSATGSTGPQRLSEQKRSKLKYSNVEMKLTGSEPWDKITGLEPTGGVSNYIRGRDGKESLNGIPNYARVNIPGVYEGIDLVFYSHEGDLEYDFVVKPGADPKKIQLAFQGAERMRVDDQSGDLILTTSSGFELRQLHPETYQQVGNKRVEVAGGYQLLDHGRAAFITAPYDRTRQLLIDPIARFVRTFGGSDADEVDAIAVDASGNSYVTGMTTSTDFPVTNSSIWLQPACDAGPAPSFCAQAPWNIFTSKLSPTGSILFSTYGGDGGGTGIAVDSTGVYVTGSTKPFDCGLFCTPIGFGGGYDLFLSKLSPTGVLIYDERIAGSGDDFGTAVAVDSQQNAWVVGATDSPDWLRVKNSPTHALVAKYSPTGTNLYFQTFGSDGKDQALGVAVDGRDQPWITGQTCGNGWPTTKQSYASVGCSVFVMQLSSTGTVKMSTVFGGSANGDSGTGITSDGTEDAYVVGYTNSGNFPTTAGSYQTARASNGTQAFVMQIDSTTGAGRIIRSTLFGGDGDTRGLAIANIDDGAVYVTGYTTSSLHFPGILAGLANTQEGFLSKLKWDLTQVEYTELRGGELNGVALLKPTTPTGIPELFVGGNTSTSATNNALVERLDIVEPQSQALWQKPSTGELFTGLLDTQGNVTSTQKLAVQCGLSNGCSESWKVIDTLDINHDGVGDILLYNAIGGDLQGWLLDSSGAFTGIQTISRLCGTADGCSKAWEPVGVGDFNHDGIDDLLWHNNVTGELQAWLLNGFGDVPGTLTLSKKCAVNDGCWATWKIIGIGDFDHDGIDDLFWLNTSTGTVQISLLDGAGVVRTTQSLAKQCGPSNGCSATWKPFGIADVNHDGRGDLLWENPVTGEISAWLLNGTDRILGTQSLSLKCTAAAGCPAGAVPVGILQNLQTTP